MSAFEGLRLYEIVMLVLGIVLFITTIVLMVYLITRKRSIKPLMYLFLLSIVMMGFPAISKIQFQGAVVDLKNRVEGEGSTTPDSTVREPLDSAKRVMLQNEIHAILERPVSDPEVLVTVARGQALLGDTSAAFKFVDSALVTNPRFRSATTFRQMLMAKRPDADRVRF